MSPCMERDVANQCPGRPAPPILTMTSLRLSVTAAPAKALLHARGCGRGCPTGPVGPLGGGEVVSGRHRRRRASRRQCMSGHKIMIGCLGLLDFDSQLLPP
jgi:hypothetical protein